MQNRYDVVIVGGGITGACLAWEAALRGLTVALVEKADFGAESAVHSLPLPPRSRPDRREHNILMRIAPHLVHPQPVVTPIYGQIAHIRDLLVLRFDSLHGTRDQRLPRILPRLELLTLFPDLETHDLAGGTLHDEAQIYNPQRLVLAFIQSAANIGADVLNYAQVIGFVEQEGVISGVRVCEQLSEEVYDIRARLVINVGGAWAYEILQLAQPTLRSQTPPAVRAVNLVTRSLFPHQTALALRSPAKDANPLTYIAPWRGHALIGTAYSAAVQPSEPPRPLLTDVEQLLRSVSRASNLNPASVTAIQCGLIPSMSAAPPRIIDHRQQGISGLLTVEGGAFSTARRLAEQVLDTVFALWEKPPPRSVSATTPLHSGQIERFDSFLAAEVAATQRWMDEDDARRLVCTYGSLLHKVLDNLNKPPAQGALQPNDILKAEIRHAINKEMAVRLSDVVFRRTELASVGQPAPETLQFAAGVMAAALNWSEARKAQELQAVDEMFAWKREFLSPP